MADHPGDHKGSGIRAFISGLNSSVKKGPPTFKKPKAKPKARTLPLIVRPGHKLPKPRKP